MTCGLPVDDADESEEEEEDVDDDDDDDVFSSLLSLLILPFCLLVGVDVYNVCNNLAIANCVSFFNAIQSFHTN